MRNPDHDWEGLLRVDSRRLEGEPLKAALTTEAQVGLAGCRPLPTSLFRSIRSVVRARLDIGRIGNLNDRFDQGRRRDSSLDGPSQDFQVPAWDLKGL